jgi:hypothetical protein
MNTFLRLVLARSRVFWALGVADTFYKAAASRQKHKRKYLARSHILYRAVDIDQEKAEATKRKIGCQLVSPDLDGGHMGVKGLLYFDFSVKDTDGAIVYLPGYARVREYADPEKIGNRSRVYTWRTDLIKLMCQPCSDTLGGPVPLETHGCTKKLCFVELQKKTDMKARANEAMREEGPLHARQREHEEVQPGVQAEDQGGNERPEQPAQQVPRFETKQITREVRAVHGEKAVDGKQEVWLYVPENTKAKSNAKRKGWWLYQQEGAPGHYYIGPLQDIQRLVRTVTEDIAKFQNFPFDQTHELDPTTGDVLPATVRCVTSRTLTDEERTMARGGLDIEEAAPQNAEPQLVAGPSRARKKRAAPKAVVNEGNARARRPQRRT